MNKKYIIFFISFISFLLFIFSISAIYSNSSEDENMLEKVEEEISYVEQKMIEMMNSLNDISFHEVILSEEKSTSGEEGSDDGGEKLNDNEKSSQETSDTSNKSNASKDSSEKKFSKYSIVEKNILTNNDTKENWEFIKKSAENLYPVWTTIMIDLHSMNVKNEDILNFSDDYNSLIVYIGEEDKIKTLKTLLKLYNYIPKYIEQTLNDTEKINFAYTRLNVANSYVLLEEEKWDEMKEKISNAQEYYGIIINSLNDKNNQNKLSNIYVSLNETYNSINYKDKKLYYIKYVDLMEKLFDF